MLKNIDKLREKRYNIDLIILKSAMEGNSYAIIEEEDNFIINWYNMIGFKTKQYYNSINNKWMCRIDLNIL